MKKCEEICIGVHSQACHCEKQYQEWIKVPSLGKSLHKDFYSCPGFRWRYVTNRTESSLSLLYRFWNEPEVHDSPHFPGLCNCFLLWLGDLAEHGLALVLFKGHLHQSILPQLSGAQPWANGPTGQAITHRILSLSLAAGWWNQTLDWL